ncbi:EIICBA-Glc 1 [Serratia plymuthica]|uniref:EIICBA-Glc 1 n=1 Tax=Serratia plymuthica TaxID=82996 RepID=A0A2X4XXA5_SERPL|nr:EIICBA-Glc 1 [Serratia plymuthica]
MYILVGLIMAALYFLLFRFLILRFDLKTPAAKAMKRKPGCIPKPITKAKPPPPHRQPRVTVSAMSSSPGWGANKISRGVDNCYTRLRVRVRDISTINEQQLKTTGAKGVIRSGNNVQVVYGLHVKKMREAVETAL